ncbi:MAG: YihY/virulence factor BrkB family protein [Solirubrobacteraceae bacterium]
MSPRSLLAAADRFQQAHTVTAFPVAVAIKFSDDSASDYAALIAFWAFFSIFPLLLAFVSILGIVLHGNPEFQHDVLDSLLAELPVLGQQLRGNITSLSGNWLGLAIGVIGSVWAGLGVTTAIGGALDETWAVRRFRRSGFLAARLRGIALLASFGIAVVASTAVVNLARTGDIQPETFRVLSFIASLTIDFLLFFVSFRILTSAEVTARQVMPGAVVATGGWLVLQNLGGLYVQHTVAQSNLTYGAFATVIGLLSWLLLSATMLLACAELNVVLDGRLWPRSFSGRLSKADRKAMRRTAEAQQRDEHQLITVSFDPPAEAPAGDEGRPTHSDLLQ